MSTRIGVLWPYVCMATALAAGEGFLPAKPETDDSGNTYLRATTRGEAFSRPGLFRLISHPEGKELYGLYRDVAAVKVLDPATLEEKASIPTPKNPVAIWCDGKHVVVACDESKVVTWILLEGQKADRSVKLDSDPNLAPFQICGLAPNKSLLTIWEYRQAAARAPVAEDKKGEGADKPDPARVVVVEIPEKGLARKVYDSHAPHTGTGSFPVHRPGDGLMQRNLSTCLVQTKEYSWCQYTHNMQNLLLQEFVDFPEDWLKIGHATFQLERSRLISVRNGTIAQLSDAQLLLPRLLDYKGGPVMTTQDGKYLLLARHKEILNRRLDWSYVATQDLSKAVVEFPGFFIAEWPGSDVYVSWGRLERWGRPEGAEPEIIYAKRRDGKVLRRVAISPYQDFIGDNFMFGHLSPPSAIFVPTHEIIYDLRDPGHGRGMRYRAGPLDPALAGKAPETAGPPRTAQAGKEYAFAPDFPKPANAKSVVFRIKKPLEGMKVDAASGRFTWTPTDAYIGKYPVQIVAVVDGKETVVADWVIDVQP